MKHWNFSARDKIGIAAGVLLAIAAITYGLTYIVHFEAAKPLAVSMRVGLPLFFLWLAWPDLAAFPRWVLQASIPMVILVAIRPQLLLIVIPLGLLMMFLQPKIKSSKRKPKK